MDLFSYLKDLFSPKLIKPKPVSGLTGIKLADTIFHNLIAEEKVPGLSVTIATKNQMLYSAGYGYADLENKVKVKPNNTLFRIASISKCLTGLAFGKMVEEGLLSFDDSFYKHVPYYPKKEYDFSLRQLASHTAGIRTYKGKEFALNEPYTIKESIKVFKDEPLLFKPGTAYLYNSFDFVLLSLAMQEASGIPFEHYVKNKILEPLKMTNTNPPERVTLKNKRITDTVFYTKNAMGFRKATPVNNFYKLAGGGYLSTSKDITRLGMAILNRELLDPTTYKELLSSQVLNKEPTYYGLGFQVSQDKEERGFVGHVGSSVGAYSNLFVYPKEEIVVSILFNCTDPKVQKKLDTAIKSIINEAPSYL